MIGGAWLPTAGQEDLLEAAVGAEDGVAAAWRRWRAVHDLESIDAGSARLLPLLMPRLDRIPKDDDARRRIVGAYRRTFYHGNLLRARAARALAALHAAGLPTLVLKGGVLGAVHYADLALRPMNDFDALVPATRGADAMRALIADGWRTTHPLAERLPDAYHSAPLTSHDGLEFDVHWNLLQQANEPDVDSPAWQAAEPFTVMGVPTRRLCASDIVVVACARSSAATTPSGSSPVR
ncbi:MAG: nucleotidyltransferase family protein, partial [Betaproteobacteria bacterium]